ncbi:uncharacterized protein LOC128233526 [Mya arenaria]|uniref:uncharacterized protein LOC128233526 n=1 Tax=Mya arenaria TaxID=6604 RepID=UPI0022E95CF3|nr:uncharacterized protein LOC128233526 [Mya arenaria]
MPRQRMIICALLAALNFALFGNVCAAENKYGNISVVGPAFVDREVTLKATPFYHWGCDVEFRYLKDKDTTFQTMIGINVKTDLEDGSFLLKWKASNEYNGSNFNAGCSTNKTIRTNTIAIYLKDTPGYPVLGPKFSDFNITECIYVYGGSDVYCKTEKGTEPVQVRLLIGQNSFVLAKIEGNKGSYRYQNVCQEMAGMHRRNVTCQVSHEAFETPYEEHGILCSVETGSLPVLTVPEFFHGENSTSIC